MFVAIVIWKSWGIFLYSLSVGQSSQSAWQEPLWPMQLLVPICMAWLWLTLVSQLVHAIMHLVRGTVREDLRLQLEDHAAKTDAAALHPERPPVDPKQASVQVED